MLCNYWLFNIEWHFFSNNKRNLNFNCLNFSLTDIITLIFNTISVSWNWYLSYYLERNTFLYLYLNDSIFVNNTFNYFLYLHYLNILFILNDYLLYDDFNWLLNLLNDYLRNEYLYYLQNRLLNYNYSFYNFRDFHYLFDNSRYNHNLFYNSFYLHNTRHLHNFLHNPLLNLLFNPNHFLLNHYWHWLIHMYLLHNLLLHWHQFNLLYL